MPIFEVEVNGTRFEVDAPSEQAAIAALQPKTASQDAPGSTIPAQATPGPTPRERANSAIVGGVVEGAKRFVGGIQQAAGNVEDLYNAVVNGKPYIGPDVKLPDGTTQRGETLDTSAGKRATVTEVMRQQVSDGEANLTGPDKTVYGIAAAATELGANTLAPEAALPRATTFIGGMLKNSASATMGSAMQFDSDNKKASDMLIGGVAAPVFGTLTSAGPATLNFIGRHLTRVAAEGKTAARVANAQRVLPNVEYSLAQLTGVPELKVLERAAYDSKMVNYYGDQTDKFIVDFQRAFNQPATTGGGLDAAFVRTKESAEQAVKGLRSNASQAWDAGMARAAAIDSQVIGGVRVPVSNLRARFDLESANARDPLANLLKDPVASRVVRRLDEALRASGERIPRAARGQPGVPTGMLKAQELASLLKGLTQVQREGSPTARGFATRLRTSLELDLDVLEHTPALRANKAVDEILGARAEYKRAMAAADVLSHSAAYKLMGVADDVKDVTSEDLLGRFVKFTPNRQRQVRDYLANESPEMLHAMRSEAIQDAVRKAGAIKPAADSQQDLANLTEALFDPKKGFDLRTSGLWGPDDIRKMEGVKDGLRVIQNNRPEIGGAGTQIKPEDIAINLVARHAAFVARQATRVLMSAKASEFFSDPKVYAQLTKINRSTTGSTANLAARAALLELLQTEYAPEQEQPQQ